MSAVRPTMQMIADRAGVSKMTVSRALNNDYRISRKTRERVLRIAADMGYRKSPLVSALMTQIRSGINHDKSLTLAHVHNWKRDMELTVNLRIFRAAAREQAALLGFGLDEFALDMPGMTMARVLGIIRSRGIQGIIMEHLLDTSIEISVDLSAFSIVAIGQSVSSPSLHVIDGDPHREILNLMEYLQELGYRRIGLVNTEYSEKMNLYRRRAGFLLAQSGLARKDRIPPMWNYEDRASLVKALPSYIEKHRPDVILSQHTSVYKALIAERYRIPEDIGFAHLGWHSGDDRFAGIDTNWQTRGIAAVDRLVDLLNRNEFGPPENALTTLVPSSIIAGQSLRGQKCFSA